MNSKRAIIISRVKIVSWDFSGRLPESCCNEKNLPDFRTSGQPVPPCSCMGDKANNGIECSVVMEKTSFDPRAAFPDFKLVFVNKGEKAVRLFDDFYPLKERGPNMIIKIWSQGNGKKGERPTAWYLPPIKWNVSRILCALLP